MAEADDGRMLTLADRFNPGSPEFASLRARSSYIADSPIGLVRALAEQWHSRALMWLCAPLSPNAENKLSLPSQHSAVSPPW